jgi:hypothetical protein
MTAAIALPQSHSDWLARLRSIQLGLGARGTMGLGLGRGGARAAASWWLPDGIAASSVDMVYQPIGAESLAGSYVNLANPGTSDAVPIVAPTWSTVSGWGCNGTSILDSGLAPTSTTTVFCRFSNASGSASRAVFGVNQGASNQRFYVRVREGDIYRRYGWGSSTLLKNVALTSGVVALSGSNAYLNGSSDGSVSATWSNISVTLLIGCERTATGTGAFFIGNILAFARYKALFTLAQISSVSAAMAAL